MMMERTSSGSAAKQAVGVIPARLASTRLPRKVLAGIHGRPMLWYVWDRARQAQELDEVFVATDSEEVYAAVQGWGGEALMTSPDCRSGTERIASALDRLPGEFILNVQGDEPLIDPHLLDTLVLAWKERRNNGFAVEKAQEVYTAVFPIEDLDSLYNPNLVKVVRAADGRALYFSRSPIPYLRDLPPERWLESPGDSTPGVLTPGARPPFWGHVGVYGYPRSVLAAYPGLPESILEPVERLEQLRFLEAGYTIHTVETAYHPVAVDTPADLDHVRLLLSAATP